MKNKKLRFGLVGVLNTLVDVVAYGVLVATGLNFYIANIISTTLGMVCSFSLNRSFTFRATSGNRLRQIGLFLVVTLFGLWVIQPAVIYLTTGLANAAFGFLPDHLLAIVPKGFATVASLVWNYVWYNRVVFTDGKVVDQ